MGGGTVNERWTWQELIVLEGELRPLGDGSLSNLFISRSGNVYTPAGGDLYRRKAWRRTRKLVKQVFSQRGGKRQNVFSKLTKEQVNQIRAQYPEKTLRTLAAEFGVSHETINLIVKRRTWKDV